MCSSLGKIYSRNEEFAVLIKAMFLHSVCLFRIYKTSWCKLTKLLPFLLLIISRTTNFENNQAVFAINQNQAFVSNKSIGHPAPTSRMCILLCYNLLTCIYCLVLLEGFTFWKWIFNWNFEWFSIWNTNLMTLVICAFIASLSVWLRVCAIVWKGLVLMHIKQGTE